MPASAELILAGFALLVLVAIVVLRPLFAPPEEDRRDERRDALEAAKEAKYREIRDAELDYRMGKLSEADYRTTDRELRAQAIAILERLDALEGRDRATGDASVSAPEPAGERERGR